MATIKKVINNGTAYNVGWGGFDACMQASINRYIAGTPLCSGTGYTFSNPVAIPSSACIVSVGISCDNCRTYVTEPIQRMKNKGGTYTNGGRCSFASMIYENGKIRYNSSSSTSACTLIDFY